MKKELYEAELKYLVSVGINLKTKIPHTSTLLIAAADILETGYFAAREIRMGNTYAYDMLDKFLIAIAELHTSLPLVYASKVSSVVSDIENQVKLGER